MEFVGFLEMLSSCNQEALLGQAKYFHLEYQVFEEQLLIDQYHFHPMETIKKHQ